MVKCEPGTRYCEPGTVNCEPGTVNPVPRTLSLFRYQVHGTQVLTLKDSGYLSTVNCEPGTVNLVPSTWYCEPGTWYREPCPCYSGTRYTVRGTQVLTPYERGYLSTAYLVPER